MRTHDLDKHSFRLVLEIEVHVDRTHVECLRNRLPDRVLHFRKVGDLGLNRNDV